MTSNFPYSSHLGPLLFLIFINDFPSILDNSTVIIWLFIKDVKLYFDVKSINDANALQLGLEKFIIWSEQKVLPVN